ncbi:hypothetical protein TrST_g13171 [Triparma strigata]|uniref:Glutathione S-transferase n=1 Tax=Triparma strigata TaxID=1606541 RepID=A0A9W7B9J3_9STRA|nr:hypothetical protein TrST_g13171 [Triparma strigata]
MHFLLSLVVLLVLGLRLEYSQSLPTFYTSATCPYAARTAFLISVLEVPHEKVVIDLKDKPEDFLKVNPLGKVPSWRTDEGECLYESLILNEYLCDSSTNARANELLPSSPINRAKLRLSQQRFDVLMSSFFKYFANVDPSLESSLESSLSSCLDALNGELESAGGYICGPTLTLTDVNCVPFFHRLLVGCNSKNYDVFNERRVALRNWWDQIEGSEEWRRVRLEDDAIEEGLSRMKAMMSNRK